jgi:hypothetical protein
VTETFYDLLANAAHWEFEIFLMLLFDGLIAGLLYPFVRKHYDHHIARDERERLPKGRDSRMRGAADLQKERDEQKAYRDFAKEMKHQMPDVFGTPYMTPGPWAAIAGARRRAVQYVSYEDIAANPPLWPASWYRHGMATDAIKQKAVQAEVNRKLDKLTAETRNQRQEECAHLHTVHNGVCWKCMMHNVDEDKGCEM